MYNTLLEKGGLSEQVLGTRQSHIPGGHVRECAHLLSVPDVPSNVCLCHTLAYLGAAEYYSLVDSLHLQSRNWGIIKAHT